MKISNNISCQKDCFSLDEGIHYINGAAYSPLLKNSVEAGIKGMLIKTNPYNFKAEDFIFGAINVQKYFSEMIQCSDYQRIAIISSGSYGLAVVANNLHRLPNLEQKKHIILLQEEFPNNVYAFDRVCQKYDLNYKTVEIDTELENRGKIWNEKIIEGITEQTAMVVMPHVHWIYGVKFDLEAISKKCKSVGALLIIDGTQSVGAMPFDVPSIKPDALICSTYKWLLGPYSMGLAYFSEFFDDGVPVEESWMNREDSEKFSQLTAYKRGYRPAAQRYNSGEYAHFIQMPMLEAALKQLLDWGIENIQNYCKSLIINPLQELKSLGCRIENEEFRANHLFGIILPEHIDSVKLFDQLTARKIYVSLRGKAIRVSPNVYNEEKDMWALVAVLKELL